METSDMVICSLFKDKILMEGFIMENSVYALIKKLKLAVEIYQDELIVKKSDVVMDLPKEYYELFNEFGRLAIHFPGDKLLYIWDGGKIKEMNEAYLVQRDMPNTIALGTTLHGKCFVYVKNQGFGFISLEIMLEDEVVYFNKGLQDTFNDPIYLDNLYWDNEE